MPINWHFIVHATSNSCGLKEDKPIIMIQVLMNVCLVQIYSVCCFLFPLFWRQEFNCSDITLKQVIWYVLAMIKWQHVCIYIRATPQNCSTWSQDVDISAIVGVIPTHGVRQILKATFHSLGPIHTPIDLKLLSRKECGFDNNQLVSNQFNWHVPHKTYLDQKRHHRQFHNLYCLIMPLSHGSR